MHYLSRCSVLFFFTTITDEKLETITRKNAKRMRKIANDLENSGDAMNTAMYRIAEITDRIADSFIATIITKLQSDSEQ
jgi:hypothetical protein